MKQKVESINLSLIIVIISLTFSEWFYFLKNAGYNVFEFLFTLSIGICGSAIVTLLLFIHEYKEEKQKLLDTLFSDGIQIFLKCRNLHVDVYSYDTDRTALLERYSKLYYKAPNAIAKDNNRHFYDMCCFIDRTLEISLNRIYEYLNLIEKLDFWIDSFIPEKCYSKTKKFVVYEALSRPLEEVFIGRCEAERDAILNSFHEFQCGRFNAAQVLPSYETLYARLNNEKVKELDNFIIYFNNTLYAFRDAFRKKYSKEAWDSLKNGTEYKHMR